MKKLKNQNLIYTEQIKAHTRNLTKRYGFVSDPYKTKTYNFTTALNTISNYTSSQLSYPTNNTESNDIPHEQIKLAARNLCHTLQPPCGTRNLLGLGLKFCVAHLRHLLT
jgi:hypothetical protein